jgi:hypothetical protein
MMADTDRSSWSLKRLCWAYGCAKKRSPEEAELFRALIERFVDALLRAAKDDASEVPQ